MGVVADYMDRRLGSELDKRGVLVWYDAAKQWASWIERTLGQEALSPGAPTAQVNIGGQPTRLIAFDGSY